jgi:tetraacyldisaccharide 4'-kinase
MRYYLAPFAGLYGMGAWLRNRLYDWEWLETEQFQVPVICVGNLSMGGTGKTPHIEYLIRLLRGRYKVGVLSRGYGRKTSGFVRATVKSTAIEIGDEPAQIIHKFQDVVLAVDGDRRRGIKNLLALPAGECPEVILLDDGFQHRAVTPSLAIVLTDYERTFHCDKILPVGRLREAPGEMRRADTVIVTKCKEELTPIEARVMRTEMSLFPHQELFLTGIQYGDFCPVFPDDCAASELAPDEGILLLTGIVHPHPLQKEMLKRSQRVLTVEYPDHHVWKPQDFHRIGTTFGNMQGKKRIVVTEKDAVRLVSSPSLPKEWRQYLYYIPISVIFHADGGVAFDRMIIRHVEEQKQSGRYE